MKSLTRLLMALALLIPITLLTPAPSGAAVKTGVVCKGVTGKVALKPGLSTVKKAQTITFNLPLTKCTGTKGITKGTAKGLTHAAPGTCATLGKSTAPMKITATVVWSNHKTSVFTGTTKTKGLSATIAGTVSKGLFAKQKVSVTVAYSLDKTSGKCTAASPLKRLNIKGTKPFVVLK